MADYLFLFSIGPVQGFIAQARKTQDLYAGSQLLSALIDEAVNKAESLLGNDRFQLIFPAKELESKPNRFFAILRHVTEDEAAQFGEKLEQFVRLKFKEIAGKSYQHAGLKQTPPPEFITQIDRHLEVYWAAKPLPDNYQQVYQQAYTDFEALFGASKSIRPFAPLPETGRKCSVCGERNVLFCGSGKKAKDKMQLKPDWERLSDEEQKIAKTYNDSIQKIYASPMPENEGLCAVCFTKRYYRKQKEANGKHEGFPSTAEIALYHQITEPDLLLFQYGGQIHPQDERGPLEIQLVYEENLSDWYLKKQGIRHDLPTIKTRRDELFKKLEEKNMKESDLAKYYALLTFDVDRMGQWLSGEELPEKTRLHDFHLRLSAFLATFGKKAEEDIVIRPKGKSVYSAGDDFLGFVNLSHLFKVLGELRWTFHQDVNLPLKHKFGLTKDITFSAGICIAHYKIPLGEVIRWAKNMEQDAKKDARQGGGAKDAFGIAALSHSGHVTTTVLKWGKMVDKQSDVEEIRETHENLANIIAQVTQQGKYEGKWVGNLDALDTIVRFLQDETELAREDEQPESSQEYGKISRACITNLDREFQALLNEKGQLQIGVLTTDVIRTEIERLVKRAKAQNTPQEKAQLMANCLYEVYSNSLTFRNFLSALHIADVIKREAKYARQNNPENH